MKQFPTTRWSLIVKIRSQDKETSAQALEQICGDYWAPLYNFLRIQGDSREEAEDHVQGFFLHMLSKDGFAMIDLPMKVEEDSNVTHYDSYGTLRSYLLTCLKNFRSNMYRIKTAKKRGGRKFTLSIDHDFANKQLQDLEDSGLNPEKCFDRAWALNLINLVTKRLELKYEKRGKLEFFQNFEPLLAWNDNTGGESYAELAKRLGVSVQAVKNGVHRLRRNLGDDIKAEVARTIDDKAGVTVEEELAALYSILA